MAQASSRWFTGAMVTRPRHGQTLAESQICCFPNPLKSPISRAQLTDCLEDKYYHKTAVVRHSKRSITLAPDLVLSKFCDG